MIKTYYLYQESSPHLFIGSITSDQIPKDNYTTIPIPDINNQYQFINNEWRIYSIPEKTYYSWNENYILSAELTLPINHQETNVTDISPDTNNHKIKWEGTKWIIPNISYFQDQKYLEIKSTVNTYMQEGILDDITGTMYKYDTRLTEQSNFSHYLYISKLNDLVKVKTYDLKEDGDPSKKENYINKQFIPHTLEQVTHLYNKGISYINYYREHLLELENSIYKSNNVENINNITVTPYV